MYIYLYVYLSLHVFFFLRWGVVPYLGCLVWGTDDSMMGWASSSHAQWKKQPSELKNSTSFQGIKGWAAVKAGFGLLERGLG